MPEGMSAEEVGKEIAHHAKHGRAQEKDRHERILTIAEAVLLSLVAVMAAWSGYAAAKWGTEAQVTLAKASTLRSEANRANIDAIDRRNFDSSTFESWFSAFTAKNHEAMAIAERRFRPQFKVAFDAWRRTHPETNPRAPKGPTYMPQYKEPDADQGEAPGQGRPRPPLRTAPPLGRVRTTTSERPCSWRASCSWLASAPSSGSAVFGTRWSALAPRS